MLLIMSQLQYLIRCWWLSFHFLTLRVCNSNSLRARSSGMHPTSFRTAFQFWNLENSDRCVLPSARCHSMSSCPFCWSHTGYICALHVSQMGSRQYYVGLSERNPKRQDDMAQQCNRSADHQHWGMFLSPAEEVMVVETQSLWCFQCLRGRETHPRLRLNLCLRWIHDPERVQRLGAFWEQSDSCGMQLEDATSQGGSLHARSCKNIACAMSHNTMNK